MLTFLFWNLKSSREDILTSLVREHRVDILILAECPMLAGTVLTALNREEAEYYYPRTDCDKIQLYTRFSDEYVLPLPQRGEDFTIRRLVLPQREEILLCAVHFPSKQRQSAIDQTSYCQRFADILAEAESEANHTRTVLVGDLNLNPYEDGVVTTTGLHAVMTRNIARRETRRVKFQSNLFFYNPMWSHFGEKRAGHAGTYYLRSPKTRADFWNIYDQVLVRPVLLPYFRDEDVEILWRDVAGNVSFLTDGGRPREEISDHLPVLFRLDI
jgi:hypothetical protein